MSLKCYLHGHDTLLERDDKGVLWLTCACGYRTPAVQRSDKERRQMRQRFPAVKQAKAEPVQPIEKVRRFK